MQRIATMVEETTFASGALRLEARLAQPAGATRAAVICHPHPLYGGRMDNNVVAATLADGSGARVLAGADHFLVGHEAAIAAAARDFLAEAER
ncbi:MAG TPA: hypothetical protein VL049_11520 [Candidatus Dormibacteraeota bacterium]|nr:hypothetical protein [Candidatus Dormibacteraeota bacterium]